LAVGDPPRTFFIQQETVDVERFIRGNENEHLFFCPHTFAPRPPICRTKENSIPCPGLWADLDAVDPNKLGALEPTIAWETSPKRYAGLWLTDGVVADISLNKRLTYHVGADKGGWCFTKLLRLPGSRNQKYRPAPLALLLWDDGPVHRIAELERALPPLPRAERLRPQGERGGLWTEELQRFPVPASERTPEQILDAYKVDHWTRHELLHGQPCGEDRSRALWKFSCQLQECGVPADEATVVLMSSEWSRGRDDDVVRVIDKVWSR
jgi:hypothetical protein